MLNDENRGLSTCLRRDIMGLSIPRRTLLSWLPILLMKEHLSVDLTRPIASHPNI